MASFQVLFTVEAATLSAAEEAVSQWVVTPGTTLQSIQGQAFSENLPMSIEEGGTVGKIEETPEAKPADEPAEPEPEPTVEPEPDEPAEPEEADDE